EAAHRIEAPLARDESGCAGDKAPGDHDARDPETRADLVQDHVARHFEEEVADEERGSHAEAERRLAETQILTHRQRGEADIDAIEVADEVEKPGERKDAPVDFAHRALFDRPIHHSSGKSGPPSSPVRVTIRAKVSGTAIYVGRRRGFSAPEHTAVLRQTFAEFGLSSRGLLTASAKSPSPALISSAGQVQRKSALRGARFIDGSRLSPG